MAKFLPVVWDPIRRSNVKKIAWVYDIFTNIWKKIKKRKWHNMHEPNNSKKYRTNSLKWVQRYL